MNKLYRVYRVCEFFATVHASSPEEAERLITQELPIDLWDRNWHTTEVYETTERSGLGKQNNS